MRLFATRIELGSTWRFNARKVPIRANRGLWD
jgi:hypothetical protein